MVPSAGRTSASGHLHAKSIRGRNYQPPFTSEFGMFPTDKQDKDQLNVLQQHAFGSTASDVDLWLEVGGSGWRVTKDGDRVVAGYLGIPMGQFFGGRSVPMWGIAAVGVARDALRQGHATTMMTGALTEARDRGMPISTLYASNQALYRNVGYELAGGCYDATLRTADLPTDLHGHEVQALSADDPRIADLHIAGNKQQNGVLDRGDYIWHRTVRPRKGVSVWISGLVRDGVLRGYVAYSKVQVPTGFPTVTVKDMVGIDRSALEACWATVGTLRTMSDQVTACIAPWSPAALALGRRDARFQLYENWMLRITDPVGALEGRGYNPALAGAVDLDVSCEQGLSSGRYRLTVENGSARLVQGGSGTVRVHTRALAQLYTGFCDTHSLRSASLLDGPTPACALLDAMFAGAGPWMTDKF